MANKRKGGFFITGGGGSSLLSGSKFIILIFIGIIVGGGILLTGPSLLPQQQLTTPAPGAYEIDESTFPNPDGKGNLQLKTFGFKECKGQASAILLVDRSGSMRGQKILGLRNAITGFLDQMGPESLTGLFSYSDDVSEDVSIDLFLNNETQMRTAANLLPARVGGGTWTRSAFQFVTPKLIEAKGQFPDKEFAFVFLSDGIPERQGSSCNYTACGILEQRCFATEEDPTNGTDLSQQIRDAGIRVFSIALYDSTDSCFQNDLKGMMRKIASPDSYYETPNPEDLEAIYSEISSRICASTQPAPEEEQS